MGLALPFIMGQTTLEPCLVNVKYAQSSRLDVQ